VASIIDRFLEKFNFSNIDEAIDYITKYSTALDLFGQERADKIYPKGRAIMLHIEKFSQIKEGNE